LRPLALVEFYVLPEAVPLEFLINTEVVVEDAGAGFFADDNSVPYFCRCFDWSVDDLKLNSIGLK